MNLISHIEARSHFEKGRLNTIDKGVIETLGGRKHSYEEITVITPLSRKVKVRMKNLGDDIWDTTLVYTRRFHRVGKFKGWGARHTSSNQESDRNCRSATLYGSMMLDCGSA
jgi:hypothetical protein